MADDWCPSRYKPRGGLRAMLPDWRVVLAALVAAAAMGAKFFFHDDGDHDFSFNLVKGRAVVVAMACVAPHLFSSRPPPKPGEFPTERSDARVRAVDDRTA